MLRALSSTKLMSARSVVTTETATATAFPESRRVRDQVGAAALRYEESRSELRLLIASLREQHSLVLKTSEKRLETAKRFEKFLADTPLSEMVSEAGTAEDGEKIFARSGPGPAPATTPPEERRREPAAEPSSPSPISPERAEGAPDGGGSNSAEEGDEYERLISSRSSSDSAASETPEEGDAEAGKRELGSPDNAREVDSIGSGISGNEAVASEDNAAEEEAKEEEADEGPKAKAKQKPPESDEEMAMRLAKEWAHEAEGWAGPSPSVEKGGEKGDGDSAVQACPADVSDSTRSRSSEGSGAPPAAESEPRAERTPRERAEKEEAARHPRQEPPFQSLVFAGGDFDRVHRSYVAVHEAAHKLTVLYSDRYVASILNYVEEWDRVVSSRVHGRIMEFERMGRNLEHYVRKVDGLRTGIEKRESRNRRVSPGTSRRFDRNELKLGGAREAYDSYGESTLLLLEEVADRAWRDCLPLLTRVVRYDADLGADSAEVLSALNETAGTLEELGEARGVDPDGRLGALKDCKPEEVYTGGKYVVPPVRSARDVFEV